MFKLRLETSDARFVAFAWTLPGSPLPPVVVWGQRFFTLHYDPPEAAGVPVYREVMLGIAFPENQMPRDQTDPPVDEEAPL